MKKYFLIAGMVFLAASCQSQPPQNQNQNPPPATTTPSSTQPTIAPQQKNLTLQVYTSPDGVFKINYTSNFKAYSGTAFQHAATGINPSACNSSTQTPIVCLVLNDQTLANTNFESAAVSVIKLPNKNAGQCATFTADELGGGHLGTPVTVNGVVFVTAETGQGAAGTVSQTHMSRTYYGNACYQINEAALWSNPQNYNPPRPEVDQAALWQMLDAARGGFRFVKK